MSNLRQAAQQALVAMKSANHVNYSWACVEAVAVLEAALAEDALQRLTDVQQEMEDSLSEPVAWMCSDDSLVQKGYSRFSLTCAGDWDIPVYVKPQENAACDRCEELASDKATWYRMAEMFANRLEELKKKGVE
jgi:hypothetical protein